MNNLLTCTVCILQKDHGEQSARPGPARFWKIP